MPGKRGRPVHRWDSVPGHLDFMADDDEMRSAEVAELLGVPHGTVRHWCATGELKARKDPSQPSAGQNGGPSMIRAADLRAFVEQRR